MLNLNLTKESGVKHALFIHEICDMKLQATESKAGQFYIGFKIM